MRNEVVGQKPPLSYHDWHEQARQNHAGYCVQAIVPGLFNSKLGYTYVLFFYAYVYLQPSRYGESSSMLSEASLIQVSHATSVV